MRWFSGWLGLLSILLVIRAEAQSPGSMTPLTEEKLTEPYHFTQQCQGVSVVEWRASAPGESSPAQATAQKLDQVCHLVFEKFFLFVAERGYQVNEKRSFSQSISIIPANENYRNLNDVQFRFRDRTKEYDDEGNVIQILGYHQRAAAFIYIHNQILTSQGLLRSRYRTVLAHELFHALSWHYGVYRQHAGNKDEMEEELAQEFTEFLGWGR